MKKKINQGKKANPDIDSEQIVLAKFQNWQTDEYAQKTLLKMGYELDRIKEVIAYIDEDKNGNRKVKLKVNLKPISQSKAAINELSYKLKNTINTNENAKNILGKIYDLKDKALNIISKYTKNK